MITEMIRIVLIRIFIAFSVNVILLTYVFKPTSGSFLVGYWSIVILGTAGYALYDCTKIYDKYKADDSYTGRTKKL